MQATVRSFAPATRSGTVLLDDGGELPFDAAAFDAGGVRLLRVGQRVRIRLQQPVREGPGLGGGFDAAPRITFLTIATLPDPL